MLRRWVAAVISLGVICGCSSDASPAPTAAGRSSSAGAGSTSPGSDLPSWRPVGGLHIPRDDFATAVVDGRIWALGGMTGDRGNRLRSIEIYDPVDEAWTTSGIEMPVGLASLEGVAVGDRIFVFGGLGEDSRPTDFAAVLDTSTGRWRHLPALPHRRYAHTVTLHDGLIHVVGGESVAGAVREVDVFDVRSRTWAEGTPMPSARGSHDAVSTRDGVYVLGGWLEGGPTSMVQLYDPQSGRWTAASALPEPVSRAGAAVLDGRLWVSYHDFAAALDLTTGEWERARPPPLSRHGLGFVAMEGALYAIGGCQEFPLRDVRTVDVMQL